MAYVAAVFYFLHYPLILLAMACGNRLLSLYETDEALEEVRYGRLKGGTICGSQLLPLFWARMILCARKW